MKRKHWGTAAAVPVGGTILLLGALTGCLDVADGRARIDARVGQASAPGFAVAVDEGLAAVRAIAPGQLHVWAGAPDIAITVTLTPGLVTWRLRVENAMPTAELMVVDGAEAPVPVLVDASVPTDKTWTFTTAGGLVRLRVAPPDQDDAAMFRHAVFADVQDAIDDVQDIYRRMNADPTIRFAVMSGDLTRRGRPAELERFQAELKQLNVPCFSTLGNHELGDGDDRYHRYFGRGSRRFRFHGAQFTLLDSASATIAPDVYAWLDGWLTEGRQLFHAVFMHIPPLDAVGLRNGAFASRAEANMLLGRLARAGVDLTIYGHLHSYYAFHNAGIPAFITGGGGAIPERLDRIGRHFLTVDVDPTVQTFQTAIVFVD